MLTNLEKAIIQGLQALELKRDTIMAFMVFLKQSNPNDLNGKVILNKVKELMVD